VISGLRRDSEQGSCTGGICTPYAHVVHRRELCLRTKQKHRLPKLERPSRLRELTLLVNPHRGCRATHHPNYSDRPQQPMPRREMLRTVDMLVPPHGTDTDRKGRESSHEDPALVVCDPSFAHRRRGRRLPRWRRCLKRDDACRQSISTCKPT
jgi:hypothetical protein